jgi:hypothetical protein
MYFYSISHRDLPIHQQAIQAAHAQHEYCRVYHCDVSAEHPTFVWLTVKNVNELRQLRYRLGRAYIKTTSFTDVDIDPYSISAISCMVDSDERHIFEHLPLWNCYQKPKSFIKRLQYLFF